MNKAEEFVKHACRRLKDADYSVETSCGLHVHLAAEDFKNNSTKLAQVLRTAYASEDILLSMLPSSRWNNDYARRIAGISISSPSLSEPSSTIPNFLLRASDKAYSSPLSASISNPTKRSILRYLPG